VFAHPAPATDNPFHRHIVARHAPEWASVPHADELEAEEAAASAPARPPSQWRRPVGNKNYDSRLYWQAVGRPILEEALAVGGWWTEVFEPDLAADHWREAPDELAILHLLPRALLG
jgi:hypothetical protein